LKKRNAVMAVLITGGSGFVGLAFVDASLRANEEVVAFSSGPPPPLLHQRIASQGLTFVEGDIRSRADVQRALSAMQIDRVIHAAAITAGPEREVADPQTVVDVNVGGTACLMSALSECKPRVRRVVCVSSVAVYGLPDPDHSGLLREGETCPAPATLYGITKLAAEQTALRLGEAFGIDTRVIRLGPVFGPWEYRSGVRDAISPHLQAMELSATGRTAILPRRCAADWIYSRDAASGIRAVLGAPKLGFAIYNLASGKITDLPAWCTELAKVFPDFAWRLPAKGERPNVTYGLPRDRAAMNVSRMIADVGFQPSYELSSAATDYGQWFVDAGSRH
jgi:nucleoside-diphosphate-sugar epimerase